MFDRWKKTQARPNSSGATSPVTRPTGPGARAVYAPAFRTAVSLLSDAGCVRTVNEDCGRWIEPREPEALAQKGMLLLVADGMGGHAAGEVASRTAVETITRVYYESSQSSHAALTEAFHAANRAIRQAAEQKPRLQGMGTTCTALAICAGAAYSAQVGDSRLYLVRGGEIFLMSEDHSAVMEMVRQGRMTIENARRHTDKNIILRALGTQPEVGVSAWNAAFPVREGDCFVLCSDGLYDLVTDEEIKRTVIHDDPHAACESLVALAKERGGYDNITVGVARLNLAPEADERETRELPVTREFAPVRI